MAKKNVSINIEVDEIYTKDVKPESNKGGKIYVHKNLIGKKVIVLCLKNGNGNTKKSKKGICDKCGKRLAITLPPHQRFNIDEICVCDKDDPIVKGILKKIKH